MVPASLERAAARLPPGAGAVVMGTGIVALGLAFDGHRFVSHVLLGFGAAAWAAIAVLVGVLAARAPGALPELTGSPAALTAVAATAVLGAGLAAAGALLAAAALLVLALALWLALLPPVLRAWTSPTVGASFLLAVSTESLGALAATIAREERIAWLALAAIAFVGLGLAAYLFVLARFDLRELLVGRGDHWVSGGALAIAALAGGLCGEAAGAIPSLAGIAGELDAAALGLWAAAALWLPGLLACELVARRSVRHPERWSTLFPVGMYAVCSFVVGSVLHVGGLTRFARVWIWVALALWLVVAADLALRTVVRRVRH